MTFAAATSRNQQELISGCERVSLQWRQCIWSFTLSMHRYGKLRDTKILSILTS